MQSFFLENKTIFLIFLIGGIFILPNFVFAASLYFSPSFDSYNVGKNFVVNVLVESTNQAMNAVSGAINFPIDKLEVVSLSKTNSIINLWVQEPSFSNALGTINFEGIVLNPGFTGATGKIIGINFKAKAAGVATLNFSSGSVLANDGKGTNILTGLGNANFAIGGEGPAAPEIITPAAVVGTPEAPVINSPTHPDPNKWYALKDAKFTWQLPPDVIGVRLLVAKIPNAIPTVTYTTPISSKEIKDLPDGIWYFSVRLRNNAGWGAISHFRFQIDTEPPKPFVLKFVDGKETDNPRPTILFDTTDSLSGIEYYKIKIGEGDFFVVPPEIVKHNPYTLPLQAPGKRSILVQAFDKAGNYTTAGEEFIIKPIEPPVITEYPKQLPRGETLIVKGMTKYPEAQTIIWLEHEGEQPKSQIVRNDPNGNFTFVAEEKLKDGIYKVWAEVVDQRGARSTPSEKIAISVEQPAFLKIGTQAVTVLSIIVLLVALIILLLILIWYGRYKFSLFRKKAYKETEEAKQALHRAFMVFIALKKEIEEQVAKLDGKPDLSERESEICDNLKKALKISEEFIAKEIKDIEKEIKK